MKNKKDPNPDLRITLEETLRGQLHLLLHLHMKQNNIERQHLAFALGVSNRSIDRVFSDDSNLRLSDIALLASALGLKLELVKV